MRPKEKSDQLLKLYWQVTLSDAIAKEAAIKCVEQIIETLKDYAWSAQGDEYWQEVLSHLQNS